jgi:hypothetical protein
MLRSLPTREIPGSCTRSRHGMLKGKLGAANAFSRSTQCTAGPKPSERSSPATGCGCLRQRRSSKPAPDSSFLCIKLVS